MSRCSVAFALLFVAVVAGQPRAEAADCPTQPPPAGVPERCRSMAFVVTNPADHRAIRATLDVRLREWMEGCFPGRTPAIPDDGEDGSIEYVFDLVKEVPSHHGGVRILPEYAPVQYSEGGRTCWGAESVAFRIAGARGSVDADEEIEVTHGAPPTSEMIKDAAAAAQKALRDPSVRGSASLSRFLSVLHHMESSGSDLDDTWYNVQPFQTGDATSFVSCYKPGQDCLPAAEALKACERHLAAEIVDAYDLGKIPARRFADFLQAKAADIQSGIDHLHIIQSAEGEGAVPCPSIKTAFMPRIAELARRHSVYGAGQY